MYRFPGNYVSGIIGLFENSSGSQNGRNRRHTLCIGRSFSFGEIKRVTRESGKTKLQVVLEIYYAGCTKKSLDFTNLANNIKGVKVNHNAVIIRSDFILPYSWKY